MYIYIQKLIKRTMKRLDRLLIKRRGVLRMSRAFAFAKKESGKVGKTRA